FADPMVDCRETRARYRAYPLVVFRVLYDAAPVEMPFAAPGEWGKSSEDELIEPHKKRIGALAKEHAGKTMRIEAVAGALEDDALRSRTIAPGASQPGSLTAPRAFNLMFKTHVGALEDASSVAYLRPETAQ